MYVGCDDVIGVWLVDLGVDNSSELGVVIASLVSFVLHFLLGSSISLTNV